MICPKCQHEQVVKNGHTLDKQRWKCKKCNYQFTRTTPRGNPYKGGKTTCKMGCYLLPY